MEYKRPNYLSVATRVSRELHEAARTRAFQMRVIGYAKVYKAALEHLYKLGDVDVSLGNSDPKQDKVSMCLFLRDKEAQRLMEECNKRDVNMSQIIRLAGKLFLLQNKGEKNAQD